MLGKPIVYRPLFLLITVVMAIAWLPVSMLHWVAPNSAGITQAHALVDMLVKTVREPGCKEDNPYFLPGDAAFQWEPGDCWTLGFAKQNLTNSPEVRENIKNGVYVIPGFNDVGTTFRATDIMDDLFAKAVYLDDNTGRGGILYAVVDCFGLTSTDVNAVRALIWDWAQDEGIKSIQVAATHTHAGIDTIGTGNILGGGGKVPAFQQLLIEKTAQAMKEAYGNRQNGKLYMATAASGDLFADFRAPYVFDPLITRFRFQPTQSGKKDVYLISAGVHPEASGRGNQVITADFPAYAAKYIFEKTGAETMFIQGALGALITVRGWVDGSVYGLDAVKSNGKEFAQYVLGEQEGNAVSDETELPALLNIVSAEYELPFENIVFILGSKVNFVNYKMYNVRHKSYKYALTDEVSYLRLGDKTDSIDILIQSSELAPEVAMGGSLSKEESALDFAYPRKAIFEYLREYPFASRRQIVFGMANNFTGYILPDNDYVTHNWLPYLSQGNDRFGTTHYEETNSAGPDSAGALTEAFRKLFDSVRG